MLTGLGLDNLPGPLGALERRCGWFEKKKEKQRYVDRCNIVMTRLIIDEGSERNEADSLDLVGTGR